jgi:hypothetical protein
LDTIGVLLGSNALFEVRWDQRPGARERRLYPNGEY